jgi:hypothetical protein
MGDPALHSGFGECEQYIERLDPVSLTNFALVYFRIPAVTSSRAKFFERDDEIRRGN